MSRLLVIVAAVFISSETTIAKADCGDDGVVLQILGSGGPFGTGRASSGYIVWIEGVSRIMVDAGGGTFSRFHESGANIGDLKVLALSHFHPDHSSEVPALLWAQNSNLLIAGPSGNQDYPSIDEFLGALFAPPDGAFRVIGGYLDADTITVDAEADRPSEIYADGQLRIRGIGVPHFNVPTIGIRVDVGEASVAFSSDQIGTNEKFTKLAANVDVLVVHFAASEEPEQIAALHAKPSVWGQMAADANAGAIVLSHISMTNAEHPRYWMHSGSNLERNISYVRSRFDGSIIVAEDLMCVPIG